MPELTRLPCTSMPPARDAPGPEELPPADEAWPPFELCPDEAGLEQATSRRPEVSRTAVSLAADAL
jgi:hypothetical protein